MVAKKRMVILLCLLIFFSIFCFVACENEAKEHVHTFGEWETVTEATCTVGGLKKHVCSDCGSEEAEIIPALGHNFVEDECTRCQELKATEGLGFSFNSLTQTYFVSSYNGESTAITIPKKYDDGTNGEHSVTTIENNAFEGCSNLTSVTIGVGLTGIGQSAFRQCNNLTSIHYKGDVASWCGISGLGELMSSSRTLFIGTTIIEGELVIPDGVTSISSYAFFECVGITGVSIPDSVTNIGDCAFSNCYNLTSLAIGKNVTTIGSYAFFDCNGLASVIIPDTVRMIGSAAFGGCDTLESITIPFVGKEADKTSSDMVQYPFGYIFGTSSYDGGIGTKQYYNGSALGYDTFYIPGSLKSVTITGGNILYGAFSGCSGLTNITIDNGVTGIGDYAFYACSGLTSITIPDSVTSIGVGAFACCSGLNRISVSIGNTVYHSNGNCLIETDSKSLIAGCKNSIIPVDNSVTSIGEEAFYGCNGITNISIPDSVTSIDSRAFYGCSGLMNIIIPDSVMSIGAGAFSGCSSLESITIPFVGAEAGITSSDTYQYPFGYIFGTDSYDGGTAITQEFYRGSTNFTLSTTYYIPFSLRSVTVTGGNILCGAFFDCGNLKRITIGNGVPSIGDYAFYYCNGLTSITIPDSVSGVGDFAFCYCSGLASVTIGNGVINIGENAFSNCTGLMSVTIGNGVINIGEKAFSNCTGLTSVTIPDSVTSVGEGALFGCSSLESITIPFVGAQADKNSSDTYQYPFGYIFGRTSYAGGIATIQYYYGSNTSSTTSKTYYIPSSLRSVTVTGGNILYGAFYNCGNLTSITIGNSAASIGGYGFYNCSGITSITIPDSVTSIGNRAFAYCSILTNIDYNGTTEQWNAISKGTDWNKNTGDYTIHCTDGDIAKQ